jgi:serine/threonine-protein kinase
MADDSRVRQLLEEALDSGLGPEEVCRAAGAVELLPQVRRRWQRLCLLQAQLGTLFPPPGTEPPAGHAPGELPVLPDYEVQAVLGRGGMGVVYRARHLRLERTVALKMLLAGPSATAEERERFLREARAVAGLRHPNIIQVHDVSEVDGQPYFTMEYVEGGSLAQKLAGAPQPARQAAALVATLAEAVQAAHQGGIIHRDLKPANVLLAPPTDEGLPAGGRPSWGTPRITDFGLARRLEGGGEVTLSGIPIGTPSYMAPEQARGQREAVGPATDVYALGAILYEMLTGRPPFRAETAVATLQQVLADEPAPPSRLNSQVPRDLETICLKCLHKEPPRRYPTAAALADDLGRFERGEPIAARPAGRLGRLARWARRRPTAAALCVALLATALLALALVGGGVWLTLQQAQRRQAITADLDELVGLQERARWAEARAVLERAEARLDGEGPDDLRRRLDQARRGLDLVIRLDAIRLKRLTRGELAFYKARASREYAEAFEQAGLGTVADPPPQVAARINASAVRGALVAAVHDWAACAADRAQRGWLLKVARPTGYDSDGWRKRAFDPAVWEDPELLAELARTAPVAREPVSLLLALGERLRAVGGDAAPLLRRVLSEHPADFWANLVLGDAVLKVAPVEAGGYYRAALASRPGAAVGYTSLGDALNALNLRDEAIAYHRRAVQIDPQYARGHTNLGNILKDSGQVEEALACYRRALEVDPEYAWAHYDLANLLRGEGRREEALAHYRRYHDLDPANTHVANILRADLVWRGRGEEVLRAWKKALEADPPGHAAWFGYAELCLFLGREAEYRRARQDLLRRFGDSSDPYVAERTARAVLLLPAAEEELRAAAALAERAVAARATAAQWVYPYFLFAQGLAEYRQGHYDSAIAIMRGGAATVMGPAPRLVVAMADYRKGQREEARKSLAATISDFDWRAAQVAGRDDWIWHVLRREAEALIVPNLPAFLRGEYQPRDNDERLAFLGGCQFRGLYAAAAQLYADAFAANGAVAEELSTACRYRAACCAAQAGCGGGADGAKLSAAERARWRRQARDWLRLDLAAWTKRLEAAKPTDRAEVRRTLARWRADPDLAGLRDPAALERLPPAERQECRALWRDLEALLGPTPPSR